MTGAPDSIGHAGTLASATLSPPLVSVVIVNYNYGRFLKAAVDSVFLQTYSRIECIVVDNASTDESSEVIEALVAAHPSLKTIWRETNDGQTPASLDGLAASSGAYVIFVDADDFLLPLCVETHILAHLCLRTHVGFTSVDMLQVVGDDVVVAAGEDFGRYIRRRKPCRHLTRPLDERGLGFSGQVDQQAILDKLFHVPPLSTRWVWSPTSGNCYRRDALLLFADNVALATLRSGTDMYFAHAIGALSGSVLIDVPLFAYRVHLSNAYTRRAQLERTLVFTPGSQGDSNARARALIIDQLVAETARFTPNIWLRLNFVVLALRLDCPDVGPGARRGRSRLARRLIEAPDDARRALGCWLSFSLMLLAGVPLPTTLGLLRGV